MFRNIILGLFIIFFIYLFTSKIAEGYRSRYRSGQRIRHRSGHRSNSGDPKGRHMEPSQYDEQRRRNNARLTKNRKAANKANADAKVAAAALRQREAAAAIANRPRYVAHAPPRRRA
jgi:hypothetical protein